MPQEPDRNSDDTRRLVSFAQNAEDIVLYRALGHIQGGFFVDVGANEPTHDSVTKLFYDRGWTGINIEPQVSCYENLCGERPLDINLNLGVGSAPGDLTLWVVPEAKAMSTFSPEQAGRLRDMGYHTRPTTVEVATLAEVFTRHVGERTVDFLKVDVEGLEEEVLGTFDWAHWRPRVVVVESYPEIAPWEERLRASGYQRTLWDGINLFFVRDEDAEIIGARLRQPATVVLDRFDPWLYVQQIERAQTRLAALLVDNLRGEFDARSDRLDENMAAATTLGEVLGKRPDVVEHFGGPPGADISALLIWASNPERAQEPHGRDLLPYASVYRKLSFASPNRQAGRARAGAPYGRRLYGRAKQALPAPVRRRFRDLKRRLGR